MNTYLVTGASRGIGKSVVQTLCRAGHKVVGVYNKSTHSATNLKKDLGLRLEMIKADLSRRDEIERLIHILKDTPLHGIVHCAGVFLTDEVGREGIESWDESFAVNVTAPLLLTKGLRNNLVAPAAIVMVASNDAFVAGYASYSYPASKAALLSLTKSFAALLGPEGIRVNAVAPSWIDSDSSMDAESSGVKQAAQDKAPLGRNGSPREVASVIDFLLSAKASYINGETIVIDGGYGVVDTVLKQEYSFRNKH